MPTTTTTSNPFTVEANQPTIDRFTTAMIDACLVDEFDEAAGVRTAGWADGHVSFEGFDLASNSHARLDHLIDIVREECRDSDGRSLLLSVWSFVDKRGRFAAHVSIGMLSPEVPS